MTLRMMTRNLFLFLMATAVTFGSGCSTHPPKPDASSGASHSAVQEPDAKLSDSAVDIAYVLGHSHRRFRAWAKNKNCNGQTFYDRQVTRESAIDESHYAEFLDQVAQFINASHRKPAGKSPEKSPEQNPEEVCRTPFKISMRIGSETKELQGCRDNDERTLGHLVRNGEFLLFSKK